MLSAFITEKSDLMRFLYYKVKGFAEGCSVSSLASSVSSFTRIKLICMNIILSQPHMSLVSTSIEVLFCVALYGKTLVSYSIILIIVLILKEQTFKGAGCTFFLLPLLGTGNIALNL